MLQLLQLLLLLLRVPTPLQQQFYSAPAATAAIHAVYVHCNSLELKIPSFRLQEQLLQQQQQLLLLQQQLQQQLLVV